MSKIIEVNLPEYSINQKPDYIKVGRKIDDLICKNFLDGKYIYRAIGSSDHSDLTLDELANKILETGTDKYDPKRKEVCFKSFCMYNHDINAGYFEIKNGKLLLDDSYEYNSLFGDTAKKFYENVLLDRGYRVRIDLLILYNADKLEKAKKVDKNSNKVRPELEECLFKFKDPTNKVDALIGIVKIIK